MINIYTTEEIRIMRQGGKILARIIEELKKHVKPGITTEYLNEVAEDLILKYGAEPSFKGFNKYPASLCTSINEEIVHALPSERKLKQGDILSLDLGIRYKGYCTDVAISLGIGKVEKKNKKLIDITKKALGIGIAQCKPGNYLQDIGSAIQKYVEKNKFNVVQELCGHGVGKDVHEEPQVLNYLSTSLEASERTELKEGMVLALEPMVVMGDCRPGGRASPLAGKIEKCKDGFGYKTKDNSLSAHFEHTIAITKNGPIVLTKV